MTKKRDITIESHQNNCSDDESAEHFNIGQVYEDHAAITQICNNCGNNTFYVGQGSYYTAVKCTKCGIEGCVHEG